jgi:hypothetical protein
VVGFDSFILKGKDMGVSSKNHDDGAAFSVIQKSDGSVFLQISTGSKIHRIQISKEELGQWIEQLALLYNSL